MAIVNIKSQWVGAIPSNQVMHEYIKILSPFMLKNELGELLAFEVELDKDDLDLESEIRKEWCRKNSTGWWVSADFWLFTERSNTSYDIREHWRFQNDVDAVAFKLTFNT